MSDIEDDIPKFKRVRIDRSELAKFLPTPSLIKSFEDLTSNVQEALPDAIVVNDEAAQNALVAAVTGAGAGQGARASTDKLTPSVQALEAVSATNRLPGDMARLAARIDQLEALSQTTRAADLTRLSRRLDQVEYQVQATGLGSEVGRISRRVDQLEAVTQALTRANSEIQRLQSRIANLETLALGV